MLNNERNVQECDATDDDSSNKARLINVFYNFLIKLKRHPDESGRHTFNDCLPYEKSFSYAISFLIIRQ